MTAMDFSRRWTTAAGAALGVTALALTLGCNSAPQASNASQPFAQPAPLAGQAGTPVVVSCEPHQRTLVRPAVVNGVAVSQVECVAVAGVQASALQPQGYAPVPVSYQPVAPLATRRVAQPVYSDVPDAQVVPVSAPVRTVRTNQVVYEPVSKKRSVAKSAIIIGSSAGAGAGVGAAIGGKKGALIGAAIGGGGATLWDQITRRK